MSERREGFETGPSDGWAIRLVRLIGAVGSRAATRSAALVALLCAICALFACASAAAAFTPVAVGSPQFTANSSNANRIAFSPDGSLVADVPVTESGAVSLYQTASTSPLSYSSGFTQLPGSPTPVGSLPTGVTFNPTGTLLAVSNSGDDTVSVFHVEPTSSTAALVPVAGSPFTVNGVSPSGVAFSPDGSMLLVPNLTSRTISLYSVAASGALTESDNSPVVFPVAADASLTSARFSPNGSFLAVPEDAENSVVMFEVSDGSNGPALTEVPGSPFPVNGTDPETVSFNASGSLLAVTDTGSGGGVSVFSVDGSGKLTEVPGSPFTDGDSGASLSDAEFSPSGNLLAATDEDPQGPGTTIFTVAGSGTLTAAATIAPVGGRLPENVAWEPKNSSQGDVLAVDYGEFQLYTLGPVVTITTPGDGAAYTYGQSVDAQYTCADVLPVTSCNGTAPSGSPVPLPFVFQAPLPQPFVAVGTDSDGYTGVATTTYIDAPGAPVTKPPSTAPRTLPSTPVTAGKDSVKCTVGDSLECAGNGWTMTCSIAAPKAGQTPTGTCSGGAPDIQCTGSARAIGCSGVTTAERFTCKATGRAVVSDTTAAGGRLRCVGDSAKALVCKAAAKRKTDCVFDAGATLTAADSPLAGDLSPLRFSAHPTIVVSRSGEGGLSATCPRNQATACTGTILLTDGKFGEDTPFSVAAGHKARLTVALGELVRQGLSSTDGRGSALGVTTSVYAVALSPAETGTHAFEAMAQAASQYHTLTSAGIAAQYLLACGFTQIKVKPPSSTSSGSGSGTGSSGLPAATSWSLVVNKPSSSGVFSVPVPAEGA